MSVVDPAVLAERRAARAERGEDALKARAADAERAVVSLERRLSDAESQLDDAARERDTLADRLTEAERQLTVARQQAFAEEQGRIDAEDEVAAALRDLAAAEERAAALEEELAELHRHYRDERSETAAEIVLLQHELDRRLQIEETLRGQLADAVAGVGRTLDALRLAATPGRAAATVATRTVATPALVDDLGRAAERLRAERPPLTDDEPPAADIAPAVATPQPRRSLLRRLLKPRS